MHSATHVYQAGAVLELRKKIATQDVPRLRGQRQYVEHDIAATHQTLESVTARVGGNARQFFRCPTPAAHSEAFALECQGNLAANLTKTKNANGGRGGHGWRNESPLTAP